MRLEINAVLTVDPENDRYGDIVALTDALLHPECELSLYYGGPDDTLGELDVYSMTVLTEDRP